MTDSPSVRRVRHELKMREVEVVEVARPRPGWVRVTLAGDELRGFVSASFDDHVKVFFPAPGQARPALPTVGPTGIAYPEGQPRPAMRDFTPRRFDASAGRLVLDFVLHDAGPASEWAEQAQVGQRLGIGGPRGSFVVDETFAWYLFVGDACALPAIARRLEELPADRPTFVIADAGEAHRSALPARGDVRWVSGEAALLAAVRAFAPPAGTGHAWGAGESAAMKQVRAIMLDELGLEKRFVRVSSYWKRGAEGVHETFED